MNILLTTEADAATAGAATSSVVMMIVYIVFFVGIFYFMMYRPQKKEQKAKVALINSIEVGDTVCTTSGFYGVVIDVTDEDVIVEFGSNRNCRIPMRKSAIEQVEKADA